MAQVSFFGVNVVNVQCMYYSIFLDEFSHLIYDYLGLMISAVYYFYDVIINHDIIFRID